MAGNAFALVYILIALVIHYWLILKDPVEWKFIAIVALVGCLWDMLMVSMGVIRYDHAMVLGIPVWLVCLWLLFATTFMHSLYWMRRYLPLAVIFAALFGPASYWLGSQVAEAELSEPMMVSMLTMAIGWGLLFPYGIYWAGKLKQ